LCQAYYEPVVAFLSVANCGMRMQRASWRTNSLPKSSAAEPFVHAEQERGRFRSYLLGAVKHFFSHHTCGGAAAQTWRRRGNISLNDTDAVEARSVADASVLSPDAAFDRQWALTVLARALEELRVECVAEGRAEFFEQVKPWLTGDAAHGDQTALAANCGMNANALKVAVHRLKKRFRELLKAEVAGTLDDAGQVEAEMRALFAALGG
jgi:RNA polymerase sigma-70 factor (ECF subfamily)